MQHQLSLTLLSDPAAWPALFTLIALEVMLGVDNLIFIAILSNKLPPEHRTKARRIGIGLALVERRAGLQVSAFIVGLTAPVGPWNFKASYVYREYDGEKIGSQVAVGVAYDLSKRTALYANYAVLRNEADYGNNVGTAVSSAGQKSRGFETGIRHVF